jgi:hypothetical protein
MSRGSARRRRHWIAALLAVGACLTAACSSGQSGGGHPSSPAASSATTGAPTATAKPPAVAPLTGLAGTTARPVIVVKIENSPESRPQSGLPAADIVTEELVEGGETRFAAFFQSADPGQVGPVRSVRNVDAQIVGPTRGILAFSGGAAPALAAVSRTGLHLVQEGDPSGGYVRIHTRSAPHNLYLRVAALWRAAGSATPASYLPIAATAPAGGKAATSVTLAFSTFERPSWAYDRATKRWLRSETGGRAALSSNGARLVADNLLILRVNVRDAGYKDPAGNPVPESVFTGSGQAQLLTGGQQFTGTWSKGGTSSPVQLKGADGKPLTLLPGRTWIELVPVQGSVQIR